MKGGKLYFRYGVMGSAKSLDLIKTSYNFGERGIINWVIKPSVDTRSKFVESRVGLKVECVEFGKKKSIIELFQEHWSNTENFPEWILVDECQFCTDSQIRDLATLVDMYAINVICYGLRTNFKGELFEGSATLMALADKIEEMKSTCSCGRKAIINARLVNGHVTTVGDEICIGGNETYVPMCRRCWNKY